MVASCEPHARPPDMYELTGGSGNALQCVTRCVWERARAAQRALATASTSWADGGRQQLVVVVVVAGDKRKRKGKRRRFESSIFFCFAIRREEHFLVHMRMHLLRDSKLRFHMRSVHQHSSCRTHTFGLLFLACSCSSSAQRRHGRWALRDSRTLRGQSVAESCQRRRTQQMSHV